MKKNITNQIHNILFLIIIFFIIFMRYNGNSHSEYMNIWSFLDGNFQNDLYENISLFTTTSIFYPILTFLGINLQNDIQGILFHYSISIFAGYFFFKIIKKYLNINETSLVLLIILTLSIFDSILLNNTKSGWVNQHSLVPSHLALCFSFYYLWQVLNKNKVNLFFSSIILLLISIKVAWFMIFCAMFFLYFDKKKIVDLYWLVPCFAFILYLLINFSAGSLDSEIRETLFNEVIRRDADETALHLQSNRSLIITIISFFIYYYFIKFVENKNLYKFSKFVFLCSIFLFIIGGLYTKFGNLIYPDPRLAMLTPVRSMYVYQLFFGILFCNFIVVKFKNNQMKYFFLAIPFFLSYGFKGIIICTILIIFFYFFSYLKISKKISFSFLIAMILLLLVLNSSNNRLKKYDFYTFNEINHWSTFEPGNKEFKSFFLNIRNCNDFMIYDELDHNRNANFFASKSRYFKKNSTALGLNYQALIESKRREDILKKIKDDKIILTSSDIHNISKENFLYLSKNKINKKFYTIKKKFGYLVFIFDSIKLNKITNECNQLIKG